MYGKQSVSKDYAAIIKAIEEGERRKPRHDRPKTVRDSGYTSFVTPAHEVVFADFDWFAAGPNWRRYLAPAAFLLAVMVGACLAMLAKAQGAAYPKPIRIAPGKEG